MQKFSVADNGNPDGTAKDRDGLTPGTYYKSKYYNDNIFNLFEFVENQGYTLIADDLSQITKAAKGDYNPNFTYNTSAIATQSVNDIVRGSDGKYYEVQNDGVTGDNPVGSVTGNWVEVPFDNGADLDINGLTSKATPTNNDELVIADSENTFNLKKLTFSNLINWVKSFMFGWGQTWQDVLASRSTGVTYTNTSGKPIYIKIRGGDGNLNIQVDDITSVDQNTATSGNNVNVGAAVPNGSDYIVTGSSTIFTWSELR